MIAKLRKQVSRGGAEPAENSALFGESQYIQWLSTPSS